MTKDNDAASEWHCRRAAVREDCLAGCLLVLGFGMLLEKAWTVENKPKSSIARACGRRVLTAIATFRAHGSTESSAGV
jgi:hypothetical protein